MAVIKSVNEGVYKREFQFDFDNMYDFDKLDKDLKAWDKKAKTLNDIKKSWKDESDKIKNEFEDQVNKKRDEFQDEMKRKDDEFHQRTDLNDEEGRKFHNEMDELEKKFNNQVISNRNTLNKKLSVYDEKYNNFSPTPTPTPTPTLTLTLKPTLKPTPAPPSSPTQPSSSSSSPLSPTSHEPVPSPSLSNSHYTTPIGKNPSNTNIENNRDGPGSVEGNINASNNNNRDSIIPIFKDSTIPLLCIILIAVVAVACAAIFVIKKKKNSIQFNGFDLKPNYESNKIQVVTENSRVITDSIINGYVNDNSEDQITNDENQTTNAETAPTDNVATTEEYTNNTQEDYESTPQYSITNIANTTEMENNQDNVPVSSSSKGKELNIDDFIPLMKYK